MFMNHLWKKGTKYYDLQDSGFDIGISFPAPAEIEVRLTHKISELEETDIIRLDTVKMEHPDGALFSEWYVKNYSSREIADLIDNKLKEMVIWMILPTMTKAIVLLDLMKDISQTKENEEMLDYLMSHKQDMLERLKPKDSKET